MVLHCIVNSCSIFNVFLDNEGPIYSYPHGDMGHAVVGGYVYRGKAFSSLFGQYIFGDYVSGYVMLMTRVCYWYVPVNKEHNISYSNYILDLILN